jgi:hypothetical protein
MYRVAGFQKKAAHWRELGETMVEKPFRYVQDQLVGEPFARITSFFIL